MLKSNGQNWQWMNSRTSLKCPRWGKGCVLQFHCSWGLSSYLIGEWNLFNVSLGIKILILNFIGEKNHSRFSLVHEGRGGHWLEGRICKLSLDKENKLKEGSWEAYQRGVVSCVFFPGKKGRKWMCEKIN